VRARYVTVLAALFWAGLAAGSGPDDDGARPVLAQQVEDLNDPDYDVRQDATEALLQDTELDLDALAAAATERGALPAETRERLLAVARHHTVRRLRKAFFPADGPGSIGIVQSVRADPLPPAPDGAGTGPPYALVTGVLPGFPACGRLRTLDRIVALNGQPIAGPPHPVTFQNMLAPLRANETVTLTVLRDGVTLTVPLTLANRAALSGIYAPPSHTLHPRFAAEWAATRKPFDWPADGALAVPDSASPTPARPSEAP